MKNNRSIKIIEPYKRKIAFFSLVVSVVLVATKITVAYFTNSMGVFSEALNNSLDVVTVFITFMAIRISTKPADRDHTYGHGKYENFSALIEIIIISFLSLFIIYKSVQRIIFRNFSLNLNRYIFIILIISILLNAVRVFFIGRAAKKYNSFALKAEFLNYSGDILSSLIVIGGLILANTGMKIADPVASIIVALIVLTFSLKLLVKIVRNLLDYIPREITEKVLKILKDFPEIKYVERLKIHEVGNTKFINIGISIKDILYSSRVEKIKDNIKNKILQNIPDSEIILETKHYSSPESIENYIKEIVLSQFYVKDIHNISLYNVNDLMDASIHIELSKSLKLEDTEKLTKIIEEKIKKKISNIRSIYIHIEDVRDGENWNDITKKSNKIISDVKKTISLYTNPDTCHNFTILEKDGLYSIAFHCRLDRALNIKQAHLVITRIEENIKNKFKNIKEVSIHVEPETRK